MGEGQFTLFQPEFNRSIHVEARPERLSADAGALLLRELMDRSGLTSLLLEHLNDKRDAERVMHPFVELLRTWLLQEGQGWSKQRDVTLLREDPLLRLAVSTRRGQRPVRPAEGREADGLCSQPTLSRLLAALSAEENRRGLGEVLLAWSEQQVRRERGGRELAEETLDLDSVPVAVYGKQPGSGYNGHYRLDCYHPLLVRSSRGDYLAARLRAGNAHTAEGGLAFVLPVVRRAKAWAERVWLRMDAGFPEPKLLRALEEEEDVRYVARLRGNARLMRLAWSAIDEVLKRPLPESGHRTTVAELEYQAGSWRHPRRVVLVMIEEAEELYLDNCFFLLTNAPVEEISGIVLLEYYRARAGSEKDFGEWQNALNLHLSSTPRPKSHYREQPVMALGSATDSFAANEARLLLSLLAANVLQAGTALLAGLENARQSRESFRRRVLKTPCRVLLHGHRLTVVIGAAAARLWHHAYRQLDALYPVRGSPGLVPLP